ncbi:hypothetical protein [Aliamphritea spongicola]|nr:hypothetical protein [Aliamphritea spongicola]
MKIQLDSISPEAAQTLRETQTEAVKAERAALTREVVMVDTVSNGADAMSEVVAQMAVQIDSGLAKNRVKNCRLQFCLSKILTVTRPRQDWESGSVRV